MLFILRFTSYFAYIFRALRSPTAAPQRLMIRWVSNGCLSPGALTQACSSVRLRATTFKIRFASAQRICAARPRIPRAALHASIRARREFAATHQRPKTRPLSRRDRPTCCHAARAAAPTSHPRAARIGKGQGTLENVWLFRPPGPTNSPTTISTYYWSRALREEGGLNVPAIWAGQSPPPLDPSLHQAHGR